jgi:hypothetical protein
MGENEVADPNFLVGLRHSRPPHWGGVIGHVPGEDQRKIKGAKEVAKQSGKT